MGFDAYEDYDATGLAALVRDGEVSPLELVDAAISRIEARDDALNAVVYRRFDEARQRARGELPAGPLRGVPYLLKDLHVMDVGHPTGSGTRLLQRHAHREDSHMVQRLRAAGLLVLGHTNTPEFGIMGITEPRVHGPTRNPWNPEHTSGGSSGGSGAAVAAGYVPAAHASDGGGSIRIPASHCGLVGLKPTRGRTPMGPHVGEGWQGLSIEHALTRTVRDTALLLDVERGIEAGGPLQVVPPERPYVDEVGRDPGRLRIAFTTDALFADRNHPDCAAAVEDAAKAARDLGHEVEVAKPPLDFEALRFAYFVCVAAGVAEDVEEAAAAAGVAPRPADFEATTWMLRLVGTALSAKDVEASRRAVHRAGFAMARFFETHDLWLTSTCARPPARVGELYPDAGKERLMRLLRVIGTRTVILRALDSLVEEALAATPNTQLANLLGLPAVSLPLWWNGAGLPVGSQWIAPFGGEHTLIRVASQLEVARPWKDARPELAPVRG
jgi:amidase